MTISILTVSVRALWLIIEYRYSLRNKVKTAKNRDQHSARVWDFANGIELLGVAVAFTHVGRMQIPSVFIPAFGLVMMVAGIAIRFIAIYTLGKFFTYTVLIRDDHRLIRMGLYKHLRHPSYTGALLAHFGLGLSLSNWISLPLSVFPFCVAALYRMHVEERALTEAFGKEYVDYSRNTKRLIPGVY